MSLAHALTVWSVGPSSPDGRPRAAGGEVVHLDADARLLEQVGRGDEHAAATLVRRHQEPMVRVVSRMLGVNDPLVDDVVQDAFIAALGDPGRYDGRASVRSWLVGIAANKARMAVRTRVRRRRVVDLFETVVSLFPASTRPRAEARQVVARIEDAVATLHPDRRATFLLTDAEGYTAREVAAMLDAPEGTVRRWRTEARAALRPLLADLRTGEDAP